MRRRSQSDKARDHFHNLQPLEPRMLLSADCFSLQATDTEIQGSFTEVIDGSIDLVFDVPIDQTPMLAGYDVSVTVSPTDAGIVFTGAAEAPNAVFTGNTPGVFAQGNTLNASDILPGVNEETAILDGAGLITAQFQVQPGVGGVFDVIVTASLFDGQVNPVPLDQIFHGTITITGLDPLVSIIATDADAAEAGTDPATFVVSRTGNTDTPLTVQLAVGGDAVNGTDYAALPSSVEIPAGQSSVMFDVTPIDDLDVEANEQVIIAIAEDAGYNVGFGSEATAEIVSDDVPVATITIEPTIAVAMEDAVNPLAGTFTFRSEFAPPADLVIDFAITGTAMNGIDYSAVAAQATLAAGSTSTVVTVLPLDDAEMEADESVTITLATGAGYLVGAEDEATVSIEDDDTPPVLSIAAAIDDDRDTANDKRFTFTDADVTLLPSPSPGPVCWK